MLIKTRWYEIKHYYDIHIYRDWNKHSKYIGKSILEQQNGKQYIFIMRIYEYAE